MTGAKTPAAAKRGPFREKFVAMMAISIAEALRPTRHTTEPVSATRVQPSDKVRGKATRSRTR
jgi:hypothetical protein